MRLLPLVRGEEFAAMLENCRQAAVLLHQRLAQDPRWIVPFAPELDIVVWAPRARTASEISALAQRTFYAAAKRGLHLALIRLPVRFFAQMPAKFEPDRDAILCLRSVLMKPEHLAWLPRLWEILSEAAEEAAER
jgi:hypothetical protein